MSRQIIGWRGGLSVLAGALMLIGQPALSARAQTPSPLGSPLPAATVAATARVTPTVTPAYTPPPTFTPQPTFTPLPPTLVPTEVPPMVSTSGPTIDPVIAIIVGVLVLVLLLGAWRYYRARHREERAAQPTAPVTPIAPPVPAASLEFTDAAGKVISFALNKPSLTLGRSDDNDLIVPAAIPNADTISHHHAQFRRDQDEYIVRDLGTQNGLTVNGRHTNHNLLQDGDRVGFGAAEAIFRKSGGAA